MHRRVRQFAAQSVESMPDVDEDSTFTALALDIARFQAEHSPGFARLLGCPPSDLRDLADLPLLPSDAFRWTRVALHPPQLDACRFQTSGTTSTAPGVHPVRELRTKQELALIQAKQTLFQTGPGIVVSLFDARKRSSSSLGHLMQLLMEHFDGRPLVSDPKGAAFSIDEPGRWLVGPGGVDVDGLRRAFWLARHRMEPLYLLATGFSLAAMLEALDGEQLHSPARFRVMITGGFKGQKVQLDETSLRERLAQACRLEPNHIIGEYGMTELTSQLFEQPLFEPTDRPPTGGTMSERWWQRSGPPGRYFCPPWLRAQAVDPATYASLPDGQPGLCHLIDLGNVDSCLSVVTQDIVRTCQGAVELCGRATKAPARGCSLPFEGLLLPSANAELEG